MSKISYLNEYQQPAPTIENRKVLPIPPKYNQVREREYLLPDEVSRIIKAAKNVGRHGHRDMTMVMMSYRHALRVSELVNLKWSQIDLNQGLIHVNRLKNGVASVHPLSGDEIRALRKLKRDYPDTQYIFITERKSPITTSTVRKMVKRAGEVANLPFPIHPHMLRHSTGYMLVNSQQDTRAIQHYMGHKNIQHTVRYTELASGRFDNFWN
ncbi:MAG: integrase [Shewanella sp.]|nr:MAG: integrase [Shewanella sp.]